MSLGTVDIVLLAMSLLVSAAIAVYHAVKGIRSTPSDYLLGGRMMGALPLAMSLTVGTISAITIMAHSGEMYANGTQLWVMDVGVALGMVVVAHVFIPIFYRLQSVSLYHYIERRFDSRWLRRITVIMTLLGAIFFLGFLLYPPSLFLKSFTSLSEIANIFITGITCSLYSSFGGVKAVVYTDVVQSIIMIIGVLAIVIQGSVQVGGLAMAWDIANRLDRIEFFNFDFDPYQRHSFWLVIVYGFFFSLSTYGVNQNQTQRAFCAPSEGEAKKVIYYSIIGVILLRGLINLSGVVIFANFADCDPLTLYGPPMPNLLAIINYVTQHLTKIHGLAGLFVASIYAAVFSSYSTQVNSITALLWEDFLKEIKMFNRWGEIKIARLQKLIALLIGFLGIAMSLLVSKSSGSFLEALLKVTGAMWGPIVGLFLVAVFLPWVKWTGATVSFIFGIGVSLWIVLGQFLTQPAVQFLPLSRDGCPSSNGTITLNTTEEVYNNFTSMTEEIVISDNFMNITSFDVPKLNEGVGFYGISYCLNYCWGTITCVGLALLSLIITGPNSPEEVEEQLIHPRMWKWFAKYAT